jgi:thiamine biosynthesis protein ThiC
MKEEIRIGPRIFTIAMTAIACIVGLEYYAIHEGINGTTLSLAIAGITGIATFGGVKLHDWLKRNKHGN